VLKLTLIWVLFLNSTSIAAEDPKKVKLTLKINKDLIAFGEPFYLEACIQNTSNADLVIPSFPLFGFDYRFFKLYLIKDNDTKQCNGGGNTGLIPSCAKVNFLLLPGDKVTEGIYFWWGWKWYNNKQSRGEWVSEGILYWLGSPLDRECQCNLYNEPFSGTYKLFATFEFRTYEEIEIPIIYSDTVEFTMLPTEPEYISLLKVMESVYRFQYGDRTMALPYLDAIKYFNTPYKEAAWAQQITWMDEPDSFIIEKDSFDLAFPNSLYSQNLLVRQIYLFNKKALTSEVDSLLSVFRGETTTIPLCLIYHGIWPGITRVSWNEIEELIDQIE